MDKEKHLKLYYAEYWNWVQDNWQEFTEFPGYKGKKKKKKNQHIHLLAYNTKIINEHAMSFRNKTSILPFIKCEDYPIIWRKSHNGESTHTGKKIINDKTVEKEKGTNPGKGGEDNLIMEWEYVKILD